MYQPTKFNAVLWHPKEGVREVTVYLGAGAIPFSKTPTAIGVQFLICDPKEGDKAVAMLFVEREEASNELGHRNAVSTHANFAEEIRKGIAAVLAKDMH